MIKKARKDLSKLNKDLQFKYDGAYGIELPSTTKIRLMSRNRPSKKDGLILIEVEVTMMSDNLEGKPKRERKYISTTIRINPKNWSSKKRTISKKEPEHEYKTNVIQAALAGVMLYMSSQGDQVPEPVYGVHFDMKTLSSVFPNKMKNKSVIDYLDDYIKVRENNGDNKDTVKNYKTLKTRLTLFQNHDQKRIMMSDINISWSNRFNDFMLHTQKYKSSTIRKTYKLLNPFLKYYYQDMSDELPYLGLSDKFSYDSFKHGKETPNEPQPLTVEQRNIIRDNFIDSDNHIAKMILLQLFTGMRYGDIDQIRPKHIVNDKLTFKPKKTAYRDKIVELPLNPTAIKLFKEVENDTSIYSTSNQNYNVAIKLFFKKLKINHPGKFDDIITDDDEICKGVNTEKEKISSHHFRDTFISIALMSHIDPYMVMKWVGHSSYEMIKIYIKTPDEFDKGEMGKML